MGRAEVKEKFEHAEYPVHIVGRHLEVTDAMKAYAVEKMSAKLKRFHARVQEATITMDIQRFIQSVDFLISVNNIRIKVSGKTENMYNSIDQAVDRLEAKLSRYIKRIHEHHVKVKPRQMNIHIIETTPLSEINDQIEEETLNRIEKDLTPHKVVSKETKPIKTLRVEEAIMKMDLSDDVFMIFMSEDDHKIKVIYRRNDGNYGIIEPQE